MKSSVQQKLFKGFTLIELLIVIGILGILLAITLVALNPARQFSLSNNTKRASDINAILNAIHQYSSDNKGLLTGMTITADGAAYPIANAGAATDADICSAIVPLYMAALPADPLTNGGAPILEANCADAYSTGYTVLVSATNNRITVGAPLAELEAVISVTR